MEIREEIARIITIADGRDPDAKGWGLGVRMPLDPENKPYPLWKARLAQVDAILAKFDVKRRD